MHEVNSQVFSHKLQNFYSLAIDEDIKAQQGEPTKKKRQAKRVVKTRHNKTRHLKCL